MAKRDEISSTEKLLELIRNDRRSEPDPAENSKAQAVSTRISSGLKNAVTLKKGVTVGVDIGYDDLKMVKIHSASPQKHELLDYIRVPFEADIRPGHTEFFKFLKKNLNRFCGSSKNLKIWSCISSARVEVRYLRIPKVPQKQLPNAVYWSHKKVAPFKEGETIFDFEILGEVMEDGTTKNAVVSLAAPEQEIQAHKSLFSRSGFPLTGVTIVPFALQNMLRTGWVQAGVKTISSLYIGRDWSRIDIFSEGNLVLSRGIKAGIKTMNEAMRGEMVEFETEGEIEILPEMLAPEAQKPQTARPKFDPEKAQKIFFGLLHDISPGVDRGTSLEPEEEEIFRMILPALKRLVQQVERTFDHYAANFDGERVEKVFVSSTVRPHRRIVDYIGDELGLPRETVDPFTTAPEFADDISAPVSEAERGAYAPAIGMALSANSRTPNFLFTYREKAREARTRLVNKITLIAAFVLLAICIGIYGWQNRLVDRKMREVNRLKSELTAFKTSVDQKLILNLVDKGKVRNEEIRAFSHKYLSVVVLTEISNITPPNVRLTNISVNFGDKAAPDAKTPPQRKVTLEGLVLGDRTTMEAALAGYLIQLSGSPLFEQPVIVQKEPGFLFDKEVLRFTAQLKLV